MAAAMPVVASAVGGLVSIVRDGVTGFLVPVGDLRAMAGRLEQLEGSPETRMKMGEEGRRCFQSDYSAEVAGRTAARIYCQLLDRESSFRL
jgi:glycosyltransferase involved in cell wall biosynthesis